MGRAPRGPDYLVAPLSPLAYKRSHICAIAVRVPTRAVALEGNIPFYRLRAHGGSRINDDDAPSGTGNGRIGILSRISS